MLEHRIFQLQMSIKREKEGLIEELSKNKPNNVTLISSFRRYLESQAQLKHLKDMEADLENEVQSMIKEAIDKCKEEIEYQDI